MKNLTRREAFKLAGGLIGAGALALWSRETSAAVSDPHAIDEYDTHVAKVKGEHDHNKPIQLANGEWFTMALPYETFPTRKAAEQALGTSDRRIDEKLSQNERENRSTQPEPQQPEPQQPEPQQPEPQQPDASPAAGPTQQPMPTEQAPPTQQPAPTQQPKPTAPPEATPSPSASAQPTPSAGPDPAVQPSPSAPPEASEFDLLVRASLCTTPAKIVAGSG